MSYESRKLYYKPPGFLLHAGSHQSSADSEVAADQASEEQHTQLCAHRGSAEACQMLNSTE